MNKIIYNCENDNDRKAVATFLYNLNKQKIDNGLANIEQDKNGNIIFNEITSKNNNL